MEQLLIRLYEIDTKLCSLKRICKQNNLDVNILSGFNTKKIKDIYSRLTKHYSEHPQKSKIVWFQSQLKLFNWILISYSFINAKKIQEYTISDWNCFKEVFYQKEINTFKYEAKRLINENCKNQKKWNIEEQQILTTIMQDQEMKNKWNEVGRKFYQLSFEKYFRTGKQCRQHWLNHLDPLKKHGKWSQEQDIIILKFILQFGKKWSTICKNLLPQRTQHMIKNRFKSLLTKHKKTVAFEEADQNYIAKKIIALYEKKQFNETAILKQIAHQSNFKPIQLKQRKQVINNIIVEKEQFENIYGITGTDENKNKSHECQDKRQEINEIKTSQNISFPSQYWTGPIQFSFIYPTYVPYYSYWSPYN